MSRGPWRLEIDDAAVIRRASGDQTVPVNHAERLEVVRKLHAWGLNDVEIADRTGLHKRLVLRYRQTLNLPARWL